MSLSVAVLKALADSGATRDMLLAAMAADIGEREAIESARIAAKRDGNRERQQRKRASSRPSRVVTPVTRDLPPNEVILTPHEKPSKPSGLVANPAKKHRLPVDWEHQPFKPGTVAALTIVRWEPGRLERELAKFRDHHTAVGTQWENWQAAWSKWVNGSQDFEGRNSGKQHHPNIGKSQAAYAMLDNRDGTSF